MEVVRNTRTAVEEISNIKNQHLNDADFFNFVTSMKRNGKGKDIVYESVM